MADDPKTPPEPPNKIGRKRTFSADAVSKMAEWGCSDVQIADFFNCGVKTIKRRKKDDPEFIEAYMEGRTSYLKALKSKQVEMALGGNTTMLIWLGKQDLGQRDMPQFVAPIGGSGDGDSIKIRLVGKDEENPEPTTPGDDEP